MTVTVTKEELLEAILDRLSRPVKNWQLAAIYNGLAECSVVEVNEQTGAIQCDEDDAAVLMFAKD